MTYTHAHSPRSIIEVSHARYMLPLFAAPDPVSHFASSSSSLYLLLVAFLGFDFWFYRAVRSSAPQRDGTIQLSGLAAPVIVTYDSLGVPNISACQPSRSLLCAGIRHRAGPPVADGHDCAATPPAIWP